MSPEAELATEIDTEPTTRPRRPLSRRSALWIALTIGLVVAGLAVSLAARRPAAPRLAASPLIGKPAPAVDADTVDGGRVSLQQLRGRWVVVNYFATWCIPCREEHPDLVRFYERHRALGDADVVGVVFSDSFEAVRSFRRTNGGTWPMAEDRRGAISIAWGVSRVPESFLVDPRGIVRGKIVGGVADARLEDLLARARAAA